MCLGNNRAGVWRNVNNATPLPIHSNTSEYGEQFANSLQCVFDHGETAALSIAHIAINACTDHQVTFVRLTNIGVNGVGHDDRVQNRLERL